MITAVPIGPVGAEQDGAGDGRGGRIRDAGFDVRGAGGCALGLGNGEARRQVFARLGKSALFVACFVVTVMVAVAVTTVAGLEVSVFHFVFVEVQVTQGWILATGEVGQAA